MPAVYRRRGRIQLVSNDPLVTAARVAYPRTRLVRLMTERL